MFAYLWTLRPYQLSTFAQMELTTQKSNRMVAEQLLSIVQQDLAEQQLRVSKETTARVKLENELVFVKVHSLN